MVNTDAGASLQRDVTAPPSFPRRCGTSDVPLTFATLKRSLQGRLWFLSVLLRSLLKCFSAVSGPRRGGFRRRPLLCGTLACLNMPDLTLLVRRADKWRHAAFLAGDGGARAAMGLIILQLHGRAPRGKQERLAFVWRGRAAGILAQPAELLRELFKVGLNGSLMKNGGSLFLWGSFLLAHHLLAHFFPPPIFFFLVVFGEHKSLSTQAAPSIQTLFYSDTLPRIHS